MGRSTVKYSSRDSGGEFLYSEGDIWSFEIIGQRVSKVLNTFDDFRR